MSDKPTPAKQESEERSPDRCTYIYEIKPNWRDLPINESVYGPAKLVCPGDRGYPNKNSELEEKKILPKTRIQ